MGRAPCCDKANVKKGPWSPEEDATLKSYIEQNGTGGNWIALPQKIGLRRCGKSCRLRWLNYLRPNIKHGGFSEDEDRIICSLYVSIGSRWSIIAAQLPGRTDNDIKNYWNTRLKKKLLGKQRKDDGYHHSSMDRKPKRLLTIDSNVTIHGLPNSNNINQVMIPQYWPLTPTNPITTSPLNTFSPLNHEMPIVEHSSVRSLLVKLEANGYDQTMYYNHQQGLMNLPPTFPCIDNNLQSDGIVSECNVEALLSQAMMQEGVNMDNSITTSFPTELQELMSSKATMDRINGLDLMAWEEMMMINNNNVSCSDQTSCSESQAGSWGDMSSFVSLPMPADGFDDLRYVGE